MINPILATGLVLCTFVPAIAAAQSATPQALSASEAQTPKSEAYHSVFDDYKPYTDETAGDWKAINATVAKIGGWRVYAKEARQPQAPDASVEPGKGSSAPAAPAKP